MRFAGAAYGLDFVAFDAPFFAEGAAQAGFFVLEAGGHD